MVGAIAFFYFSFAIFSPCDILQKIFLCGISHEFLPN